MTVRSGSATTTDAEPELLRVGLGRDRGVGDPAVGERSSAAHAMPASVSAIACARRPSNSCAPSVDWATVTAVTPTRTTKMITTCSASSWPASESRRVTCFS